MNAEASATAIIFHRWAAVQQDDEADIFYQR